MARVCRLLALLAALASAKEKKVIGPTSKRQLECTPEAGGTVTEDCVDGLINFTYDASEASLGAILAFNVYGDYRVAGGTILDSFDSDCWRDHWQEEWGQPVGELSQYYYEDRRQDPFDGGDILAYVALLSNGTRGNTLVISFRGTQAEQSATNWFSNIKFSAKKVKCPCEEGDKCGKCQVHRGFWRAYKSVARKGLIAKVKETIDRADEPPKVLVTGHSLGGAMATLMAFDAINEGITVHGLYTVGAPRVFYKGSRNDVERWRPFPYWRSVYGKDPVPILAREDLGILSGFQPGFRHVGVEIFGSGVIFEDPDDPTYGPVDLRVVKQLFGDGSGRDKDIPNGYNECPTLLDLKSCAVASDHGLPYLAMHASKALAMKEPWCAVGDVKWQSDDTGFEDICARLGGNFIPAKESSCLPFSYETGRKMRPTYDDASCAERCLKKTGSSKHNYYGPGQDGAGEDYFPEVDDDEVDCYGSVSKKNFGFGIGGGYGGDCDSKCGTGYCTYAEPSLLDYPQKPDDWEGPWNCSAFTGRICCCEGFQTTVNTTNAVNETITGGHSSKKNHHKGISTGTIFVIVFIVVSIPVLIACIVCCFCKSLDKCCEGECCCQKGYRKVRNCCFPKDDHKERTDSWDVSATFGDAPRAGPDAEKGAAE